MSRLRMNDAWFALLLLVLAGCGGSPTPPAAAAAAPDQDRPTSAAAPAPKEAPWPSTPPKRLALEPLVKGLIAPGPIVIHGDSVLFTSAGCLMQHTPAHANTAAETRRIACLSDHEGAFIPAMDVVGKRAWVIVRSKEGPHPLKGSIFELELDTRAPRQVGSSEGGPNAIAVTDGHVWVADRWGLLKIPHGKVVHAKQNERTPERIVTVDVAGSLDRLFRTSTTSVLTSYDRVGLADFRDVGEEVILFPRFKVYAGAILGGSFYFLFSPSSVARLPLHNDDDAVELLSDASTTFRQLAVNEHLVVLGGDRNGVGKLILLDQRGTYTEVLDRAPLTLRLAADGTNAYMIGTDGPEPHCALGDCTGALYALTPLAPSIVHRLERNIPLEGGGSGFELRTAGWAPETLVKLEVRGETETFGYTAYHSEVRADAKGQTAHRVAYPALVIPEEATGAPKPKAILTGAGVTLKLEIFP